MLNIIGKRKIWFTISAILILAAIAAMGTFRFREGIDFKGGVSWTFKADNVDTAAVQRTVAERVGSEQVRVVRDSKGGINVRLPEISEDKHAELRDVLEKANPGFEELAYQSVGPSIGQAVRNRSIIALILVLVGISLYIAFAFRKVFQPISSWKYGWVTLLSLLHDVVIPAGLLAVLGHYRNVEIDTNSLIALLVIMGFSVHDTIVVFDRIRENLMKERSKRPFEEIVNMSVNQTIGRSINTSLTLILVLLALLLVGPSTLFYFTLTLLVGVVTGIYSSIFIASPLLIVWQGWSTRHKRSS